MVTNEEHETPGKDDLQQKDVMSMMNISGTTMKKIRDKHLASNDWYYDSSKPGRPRIMYRPTGVAKIKVHHAAAEVLPLMVPRFCRAVVLSFAQNPKVVMARIELPTGEWVKGPVFVTEKIKQYLVPGKPMKVQLIEDEQGRRSYRHEKLCP
jgi:hypothetical protein